MTKVTLSTLFALCLATACDGGCDGAPPAGDGGTTDAGQVDDDDAGQVGDAGPGDAGQEDAGPLAETFTEDFIDESNVDPDATTAIIDTDAAGFAVAPPPYAMLSPGDGSDGDYAPQVDEALAPGSYRFAAVTLAGVRVDVAGDVTLLVDGPVDISGGARLVVTGTLTLVASGAVTVDCAIVEAGGDIVVHLPSGEPLFQGCAESVNGAAEGTLRTLGDVEGSTGSIDVWTRGAITLDENGYFFTGGNAAAGASGSVTLRAYGDVTLRTDSYAFSEDGVDGVGWVHVVTEGSITLEDSSYIFTGRDGEGAFLRLEAGGDVTLINSFLSAEEGASLDVVAAGTFTATTSNVRSAGSTTNAGAVNVAAGAVVIVGSVVSAQTAAPALGGPVRIASAGDVLLEGATVQSGSGPCQDGADVELRAEGELTIADFTTVTAASSTTDGSCPAAAGGDVVLEAGGAITIDDTSTLTAGAGGPAGQVSETAAAPVSVDVEPTLLTAAVVESVGLSSATGVVTAASYAPSDDPAVSALLSPDGSDVFVAIEDAVGTTLAEGWRYRVELRARMFDGAAVDTLSVTAAPPAP